MANTYAIIQGGVVTSTFLGDDDFAQSAYPGSIRIDAFNPVPGVGWTYASGSFAAPSITPPAPTNPVFAKIDFDKLFTQSEQLALANYKSNSSLSPTVQAELNVFFQEYNDSSYVSMTDPLMISGVELLESCGLIETGRAVQILASRN